MKTSKFEELIKQVARVYFLALKNIKTATISSGEYDYYSPFYKYYADVEEAFERLDKLKQKIINNEFFYEAYPGWWVTVYSPREFKKIKRIAIKEFLEAFYEIHKATSVTSHYSRSRAWYTYSTRYRA